MRYFMLFGWCTFLYVIFEIGYHKIDFALNKQCAFAMKTSMFSA